MKVVFGLILGIIILGAAILFLATRNSTENNSTQNPVQENAQNLEQVEKRRRLIDVTSLVPSYTLEAFNKKALVEAFESINIFGRTYIYTDTQTTGARPLENILVSIRNESLAGENLFDENIYLTLRESTIEAIFILTDEQLNDPNIQEYIMKKLIENVYRLIYKDVDDAKVNEKVDEVYDSLLEQNPNYFVITKN